MSGDGFVRMAVTAADYEVITGLMRDHGAYQPAMWPDGYRLPDGAAYLAVVGHTAVGMVAVRSTEGEATMTQILMRPGVEGARLGRLLGRHAIAAARRLGASRLLVAVEHTSPAPPVGYGSLGFGNADREHQGRLAFDVASAPRPEAVGVVAAGGASHRMGEDKVFLEVGGRPMLAWVVEALRGAGVEPVIAGRPSPLDAISSFTDPHDVVGPAAALTAVFRGRPGVDAVLVGADQPYLRAETIRGLLGIEGAAVTAVDDRRQTLCTLYRDACAPVLERLLADRPDPALQELLDRVDTVEVGTDTYRDWGEDGRSWVSVDTPDMLKAVREAWPEPPAPP